MAAKLLAAGEECVVADYSAWPASTSRTRPARLRTRRNRVSDKITSRESDPPTVVIDEPVIDEPARVIGAPHVPEWQFWDANCVIFHTALDKTALLRQLAQEGRPITPAAVAALSPYIGERIKRFGEYATKGLIVPPAAFDGSLTVNIEVARVAAARAA